MMTLKPEFLWQARALREFISDFTKTQFEYEFEYTYSLRTISVNSLVLHSISSVFLTSYQREEVNVTEMWFPVNQTSARSQFLPQPKSKWHVVNFYSVWNVIQARESREIKVRKPIRLMKNVLPPKMGGEPSYRITLEGSRSLLLLLSSLSSWVEARDYVHVCVCLCG